MTRHQGNETQKMHGKWLYKNYVEAGRTLRCRVTVKESNIGGDLTFQIKMASEIAPIQVRSREEAFSETNRIMK